MDPRDVINKDVIIQDLKKRIKMTPKEKDTLADQRVGFGYKALKPAGLYGGLIGGALGTRELVRRVGRGNPDNIKTKSDYIRTMERGGQRAAANIEAMRLKRKLRSEVGPRSKSREVVPYKGKKWKYRVDPKTGERILRNVKRGGKFGIAAAIGLPLAMQLGGAVAGYKAGSVPYNRRFKEERKKFGKSINSRLNDIRKRLG